MNMKLVEDLKTYSKALIYDTYLRICDYPKDYEKITKKKMLEDIINTYNQKDFIFNLCTKRELEFLKLIINKKFKLIDFLNYDWEIKALCDKKIISLTDFEIYDELLDSVKDNLKTYEKYPKMNIHEIIIFMIAMVRVNGELLTKVLESMITSMTNMSAKEFNSLLGNPLFRFYCSFRNEYIPSLKSEQEIIYYIDLINEN